MVSERELNARVAGALADPDVLRLIRHFLRRYKNVPEDDALSYARVAVWNAARRHDPAMQKFTSSLYYYLDWRLKDAANRAARKEGVAKTSRLRRQAVAPRRFDPHDLADALHVLLSTRDGWLVRAHYLDGHSLDELAAGLGQKREDVQARLAAALDAARAAAAY